MSKKISKPWDEFESDVAEMFGGEVVRGSGRADQHKGDVITPRFLVECKSSGKPTYYVKDELVHKIAMEALNRQRDWLFCVRVAGTDWCLFSPLIAPTLFESYPAQYAGKSVAVKKGGMESMVTFESGRRALMLTMEHAKEVLLDGE